MVEDARFVQNKDNKTGNQNKHSNDRDNRPLGVAQTHMSSHAGGGMRETLRLKANDSYLFKFQSFTVASRRAERSSMSSSLSPRSIIRSTFCAIICSVCFWRKILHLAFSDLFYFIDLLSHSTGSLVGVLRLRAQCCLLQHRFNVWQ